MLVLCKLFKTKKLIYAIKSQNRDYSPNMRYWLEEIIVPEVMIVFYILTWVLVTWVDLVCENSSTI